MKEYDDYEEGWIRLACAICENRSKRYKAAYRRYRANPTGDNRSRMLYLERKLRGPITELDDSGIKTLRRQALQELKVF